MKDEVSLILSYTEVNYSFQKGCRKRGKFFEQFTQSLKKVDFYNNKNSPNV